MENKALLKQEFEYWNQSDLEAQHVLIAGPVQWRQSEAYARSHWEMLQQGVLPLPENPQILEIGCGVGRILKWLWDAKGFQNLSGVDISPNMLSRGREYLEDRSIQLFCVEDGNLPLADESQDFVYSFLVFQHIPTRARVKKYLSEIKRVLKPGGQTRIQTYRGIPHPEGIYGFVHGSFYQSLQEFAGDFAEAGLTMIHQDENYGALNWIWVTARKES